jgi:hypothetical protein
VIAITSESVIGFAGIRTDASLIFKPVSAGWSDGCVQAMTRSRLLVRRPSLSTVSLTQLD